MLAKCERELRDEQLEAQVDTETTSVVGAGVEPAERLGSNSSRAERNRLFCPPEAHSCISAALLFQNLRAVYSSGNASASQPERPVDSTISDGGLKRN
jgi:hypothetical protein